jgi:hypothetical protein
MVANIYFTGSALAGKTQLATVKLALTVVNHKLEGSYSLNSDPSKVISFTKDIYTPRNEVVWV